MALPGSKTRVQHDEAGGLMRKSIVQEKRRAVIAASGETK